MKYLSHFFRPLKKSFKAIVRAGLYGFKSQNFFGDFHLKTTIGVLSGECLIFANYLIKKAKLMNLSLDEEYHTSYQEEI